MRSNIVTMSIAFLALASAVPGARAGAPVELLRNRGFEGTFSRLPASTGKAQIDGAIAGGWEDNSGWADVTIAYSRSPDVKRSGSSAQCIRVAEVRGGAVQMTQGVPLAANHVYRFDLWVKGQPGAQASISLRQRAGPYKNYGQSETFLNGQWQKLSLIATSTDTTDGYAMILPPVGSSLYVDDASLKDMTGAVSDRPVKPGNLLPDSSFEAGFGGGWSARVRLSDPSRPVPAYTADPRPVIDRSTAFDQKSCVRIDLPCAGSVMFSSPLVDYNYGRAHTAAAAFKSDIPGASAQIQILGAANSWSGRISSSWQTYRLTDRIAYGDSTRVTYTVNAPRPGSIWFDAASLAEGSAVFTPSAPPAVELALHVDRPGGIFYDGETAVIAVAVANAPAGARIRASALDLYGQTARLPDRPARDGEIAIPPAPARPRGVFKLTAQVVDRSGKALCPAVEQVFARLPRPRDIAPEASYFGVHIPLSPEYFQIARAVGARWCRIHDASAITKWPVAEPRLGQYVYYDDAVDGARKAGLAILGMLDGGPSYASVKPRATSGYFANYNRVDAPDAQAEWQEYVANVVAHYKGRIDYWEVWNEPWASVSTPGPADLYGVLLKEAYPAAKQANPDAVIIGVDTTLGKDSFTDTAMKTAGGSASYDAMSFHDYYSNLYGGADPTAQAEASRFDSFQSKYGQVKPLWMTEGAPGAGLASFYHPQGDETDVRMQCSSTVRFDVAMMAAGIRHGFYYTLHADPPEGAVGWCALEHDRVIRPLLAARAVLAKLVDGARCLGRTEPAAGVDRYEFVQSNGSHVQVLWSYDGATHLLAAPQGRQALDILGNALPAGKLSIGPEPIYIVP